MAKKATKGRAGEDAAAKAPAMVVMRLRPLKLGDRIRIVRLPPEWENKAYHVSRSTRAVYRKLIERRRPLVVSEIDERGLPWIWCRFRGRRGGIEHHALVVDDGCWVRVKPAAARPPHKSK